MKKTRLTQQEKNWIVEQRLTRLTDMAPCLIYPMGAERHLSTVLLEGNPLGQFDLHSKIAGKHLLIIPGYGNSAFLFAEAGAASITVIDKDPVTIAWMKAYKAYYHYRQPKEADGRVYPSVGELLSLLTCWYPPRVNLPFGQYKHWLYFMFAPQRLRRAYFFYMLSLIKQAVLEKAGSGYEWDKEIEFHVGELHQRIDVLKQKQFDVAFVPYLLGVRHGIEDEHDIVKFMAQLSARVPQGLMVVTPTEHKKEFYVLGKRYFETTSYASLEDIPGLASYHLCSDKTWYDTQGLALFCSPASRVHQDPTCPKSSK